jgi:hypothetical protein
MGPAPIRFRDAFRKWVPPWLSDRSAWGLVSGFKFLWSMIALLDIAVEVMFQGLRSAWPGAGTPTALPYIGRTRGILRGRIETDAGYAARLRLWLDYWRNAGSALALAQQIQGYLGDSPRVRVVNRAGLWITLNPDGSVVRNQQAFNWDGSSHPERAGFWSEIWVIIYPTTWPVADNWGSGTWDGSLGLGHDNNPQDYDAVNGLVAQWKSAHTKVRAVIWTSDGALFDPTNPASLPDGTWGAWGTTGAHRVASGRNYTTCRYWEPK